VLNQLAGDLELKDKKASFTSVGLAVDWNSFIGQSEFAKRRTDGFLADTTSWYVMGGYRIGKFTPYYTHAKVSIDGSVTNTVPGACPAGYPAACRATLAALSAGVHRTVDQQHRPALGRVPFGGPEGADRPRLAEERPWPADQRGAGLQPRHHRRHRCSRLHLLRSTV
jgi:hypothetical protein